MVYNGYYKVMSNIPKMGHLPTPDQASSDSTTGRIAFGIIGHDEFSILTFCAQPIHVPADHLEPAPVSHILILQQLANNLWVPLHRMGNRC